MFSSVAQRLLAAGGIVLLSALAAAGCVKQLPPAATPEPIAPAVDSTAPLEGGHGRLVVDVVDAPTSVHRIEMAATQTDDGQGRVSFRFYESPQLLCAASPCVADVPVGNLLLGFPVIGKKHGMEIELVHVGPETTVYRRSLSRYDDRRGKLNVLGIIAAAVGASAGITGVVLLPIGLSDDNNDLAAAGGITLGVGAALLAIGIWAIRHDAPTYRPGSSIHFSPSE